MVKRIGLVAVIRGRQDGPPGKRDEGGGRIAVRTKVLLASAKSSRFTLKGKGHSSDVWQYRRPYS